MTGPAGGAAGAGTAGDDSGRPRATAGIDGSGTRRAHCVLAPNPSPMTLDGTNTWVIAEPGAATAVVIDPGPADEEHLRRVAGQVESEGRRIELILLTHGHRDHSGGARRLAELASAAVRALDPSHRLGVEGLAGGDVITAAGCELRVVSSPGHSADSLSFLLSADGALLTGDTVLGRGTSVIGRDGDLGEYLRSLDTLRSLAASAPVNVLLPGHGPLLTDAVATLDFYLAHRAERLAEVTAALEAGDRTVGQIVARVYQGVDPAVRTFAAWSVRKQLAYLAARGTLPPGVAF
ncbi:MAG TPA: MBL fold metallo-hydrolase [Streptosporangiaceae bacterium]|nr:MBL fold metallo-hydrolase [Streptosporangiaceae bacterium]